MGETTETRLQRKTFRTHSEYFKTGLMANDSNANLVSPRNRPAARLRATLERGTVRAGFPLVCGQRVYRRRTIG